MLRAPSDSSRTPLLSVVVPSHNEQENLPVLHARLSGALLNIGVEWELIVVDDHSGDDTFAVAKSLSCADRRVKVLRLSRNVGSHLAIVCGAEHAQGDVIAVMAADLQDPPELLPVMLEQWRAGNQIVWAVREARTELRLFDRWASRLFNRIMASIIRNTDVAAEGGDFFLIDRIVGQALQTHRETHISIFALLQWMGFRQSKTFYTKQTRTKGRSSWNLRKKLKLFVDSIVSFSFLPIRVISLLGIITAVAGFFYAAVVLINYMIGNVPSGWSSVMVVVLVLGGIQIIMLGIVGEYLWRNLDETRQRPRYLIEDQVGFDGAPSDIVPLALDNSLSRQNEPIDMVNSGSHDGGGHP